MFNNFGLVFSLLFVTQAASAASIPNDFATANEAVERRDFTAVQNDFTKFNTDTTTLKNSVNNYNGGAFAAIAIQNNFKAVDADINQTATDITSSAATTSSQATTLINYINNPLEPNVAATVTATINKKSQFVAAGVQSYVCSAFKRILADATRLCGVYVPKNPTASQANAKTACNKVVADLQRGVTAYC